MPSVSCAHFPRIYERYARICEAHGVPLRQSALSSGEARALAITTKENADVDAMIVGIAAVIRA